jgi:hypothetical protein
LVNVGKNSRCAVSVTYKYSLRPSYSILSKPCVILQLPHLIFLTTEENYYTLYFITFFCGVGLKPPLGPFFRAPRFRFLRSLCSSPLGPHKPQHWGHIGLLCILRMIHEGDCGVIGGANNDCRGNRRTLRKPAPAPLCPATNPT